MRTVFLGTPAVAVPSLDALVDGGHQVGLVVTQPDRPVGRSRRPSAPPVKERALALGLEVAQPARVRDGALLEAIASCDPDILVVVAYGRLLPLDVLKAAPHGALNVHFSLLPAYRGAAPVQWALARGESVTGVTTMRLVERLDEGDVYLRREVPIEAGEHAPALARRLADVGAALLLETLAGLAGGALRAIPQDHARATFAPPLSREDGEYDPAWEAPALEGRVRGFDPWPGVWARCRGRRIRLAEAVALPGRRAAAPPGEVIGLEGGGLVVACGGGTTASIASLQPEGSKTISARDAVNGRRIGPGDRLERPASAA